MFNDFICRFTDTMSFVGILLLVTIASAAQGYRGKKLKCNVRKHTDSSLPVGLRIYCVWASYLNP